MFAGLTQAQRTARSKYLSDFRVVTIDEGRNHLVQSQENHGPVRTEHVRANQVHLMGFLRDQHDGNGTTEVVLAFPSGQWARLIVSRQEAEAARFLPKEYTLDQRILMIARIAVGPLPNPKADRWRRRFETLRAEDAKLLQDARQALVEADQQIQAMVEQIKGSDGVRKMCLFSSADGERAVFIEVTPGATYVYDIAPDGTIGKRLVSTDVQALGSVYHDEIVAQIVRMNRAVDAEVAARREAASVKRPEPNTRTDPKEQAQDPETALMQMLRDLFGVSTEEQTREAANELRRDAKRPREFEMRTAGRMIHGAVLDGAFTQLCLHVDGDEPTGAITVEDSRFRPEDRLALEQCLAQAPTAPDGHQAPIFVPKSR